MQEKTWKYKECHIRYRMAGEGPLLFLLHGWGANADLFAGIEQYAATKYTVVSPDLPGFGGSGEPAQAYDLDDYVDFVAEFVTAVRQETHECVLLGHSHGGRIILRLLSRMAGSPEEGISPENFGFYVSKAILTDSAGIVPVRTAEQQKRTQRYKLYKNLLTKTGVTKLAPGALDALQKKYGSADYAAASPVMRQSMVKVVNTDLQKEMPRIKIPVLLIWGDADTATPLSDGKRMEELMPEAGLAVIAGAGHYSFLDNPVLYNRILGSFLGIGGD